MTGDTVERKANSVVGHIEPYSLGDDYSDYMERMDSLITLNAVKTGEQLRFCIGFCGPDLYKIIKSCIAPKKTTEITYEEMKKELKEYFEPKRNIIAERFKFYSRQQNSEESVGDYIVEIKALSQTCEFGNHLTEALRDKLVFGLSDQKIQAALLREKELTFEKACSTAKSIELTRQHVDLMHGDNTVSVFSRSRLGPRGDDQRVVRGKSKPRYANYQCYSCGLPGHTSRSCRTPNAKNSQKNNGQSRGKSWKNRINEVNDKESQSTGSEPVDASDSEDAGDDNALDFLHHIASKGPTFIEVSVNNVMIRMEVDTGACQSVISETDKNKLFPNSVLHKFRTNLAVVTGETVDIPGFFYAKIARTDSPSLVHESKLVVIKSTRKFIPLAGRTWLDVLYPGWRVFFQNFNFKANLNAITTRNKINNFQKEEFVSSLVKDYPNVFATNGSGTIKKFKIDIHLTENATPIFFKPYTMPYGLRERTEKELNRLVSLDVIYPVRHSDWATPIIPVEKPNKEIRICADCKVTINKFLVKDHYPLPQIEDLFASLAGLKHFCVLDLRDAFQQIEVAESSQEYLTINTHLGLFRYKRLIFGISLAPTYFQWVMDEVLRGLIGTVCFIDDVLIGGKTLSELSKNLTAVIARLSEYNVRVKFEKCKFFVEKVEYLGHELSEEGISPSKKKIQAVLDAPKPNNIGQLRSYLGLINYYSKFAQDISKVLVPLYKLTKRDTPFEWSTECDVAFQNSKNTLLKNQLLVHYDPNKELAIHCDASPYGLGAILSHIIDGVDRPIMFASSTLTDAQKNYSQLHREALAIVFAAKKFHKYIYGKQFVIFSDHQPLREIFNEKKSTPVVTGRLQRWAIYLASYDYKIIYKKGSKLGNADALSRLPLSEENDIDHANINAFSEEVPIDLAQIASETRKDPILVEVRKYVCTQWPNTVNENIKPYALKKLMLAVESECIFYGTRIVIPAVLQQATLERLHDTHIGIVRMKSLAKTHVWWPNLYDDIESYAKSCMACQLHQGTPSQVKLSKWKPTSSFFERVHIDFGQLNGTTFLVLIDSFSRWMDVKIMRRTDCLSVIGVLRNIFAYFGLPSMLVADNGPPFNAENFRSFCKNNGITYCNSPPYHPQSNGWAECAVRTVKQSLKKMSTDTKTQKWPVEMKVDNFLFKYRNTPLTTTKVSPNSLIFNFSPKTMFTAINRSQQVESSSAGVGVKTNSIPISDDKANIITSSGARKIFNVKEEVLYKCVGKESVKWCRASVVEQISPYRYKVRFRHSDVVKVCHGDQLRPFNAAEHMAKYCLTKPESSKNSEAHHEPDRAPTQTTTTQVPTQTPECTPPRSSARLQNQDRPNYQETRLRKIKKRLNRLNSS